MNNTTMEIPAKQPVVRKVPRSPAHERKSRRTGLAFSEVKRIWTLALFGVMLLIIACWAMAGGAYDISIFDIVKIAEAHLSPFGNPAEINRLHNTIVWNIRFPRILTAISVGISLGTAGSVFQGCFRNPLVEPYILGISSGAAFGAALGIVIPGFFLSIQVSAFIFASIAVAGACFMARVHGETPIVTLILAGVIIGSVFSAFVGIMKYLAADSALREIVFWLMGGFYYSSWKDAALLTPVTTACFAVISFFGWKLNILSMGDEEARALGVNPERCKLILIVLATLITAVSVSAVGIIPWVGLMTPHAARMIVGPDHRFAIPASALLGAIYLVVCDTIARTLTSAEIPIGIITSIIGAPYLFYLLRAKGKTAFGGS